MIVIDFNDLYGDGGLLQIDALVHFYFGKSMEDFETLGEFLMTWKKLKFALEFDGKLVPKKRVKPEQVYGERS